MPDLLRDCTRSEPYVLVMGEGEASQFFGFFGGDAQEHMTLLGAVDVCFKTFYVYDINYPKQCCSAWEFLQKAVYQLPGAESPSVKFLRTTVSQLGSTLTSVWGDLIHRTFHNPTLHAVKCSSSSSLIVTYSIIQCIMCSEMLSTILRWEINSTKNRINKLKNKLENQKNHWK